jgi:osmotically-inducible protein OsmY
MNDVIDDLAANVEKAIMAHKTFKENWNVNVLSENGIVTLRGEVPSQQHADLAESIAKQQSGVKNVINQLDIDETLQEETELKIEGQRYVPPSRHH